MLKIKCLSTKRSKFKAELAIPSDSSFLPFGFIYLVMGHRASAQTIWHKTGDLVAKI
jgi:hypothetical protein